jgi:hypothetical protein
MTRADLRFIEVTSAIRANSQPATAQPELFMRAAGGGCGLSQAGLRHSAPSCRQLRDVRYVRHCAGHSRRGT